jgi:precorrin-8X/cobalt-precorrin-8 methylmutase
MESHNTALILVGHGSELSSYKETIQKLTTIVRQRSSFAFVSSGFMKANSPSIPDAVSSAIEQGADKIIVVPVFLARSLHTITDIPRILGLENGQKQGKVSKGGHSVEIAYCEPIGADDRLADIVLDRAANALEDLDVRKGNESSNDAGTEIFKDSLMLIRKEFRKKFEMMPQLEIPIVERVVHATADPEFAQLLTFAKDAIEAGTGALKRGADVIVDVKMVQSGINHQALRRFGGKVLTYIDDEKTVKLAHKERVTMAAASMRVATEHGVDDDIVVIGNSPTAALTIADAVQNKLAKPALIIATPVGFVKAAESKDQVSKLPIPSITVRGVKGGSAVAVAIVNALLTMVR